MGNEKSGKFWYLLPLQLGVSPFSPMPILAVLQMGGLPEWARMGMGKYGHKWEKWEKLSKLHINLILH